MSEGIPESRFFMWRAVIALVHADNKVTPEERALADNYIQSVAFSETQSAILRKDLEHPQDIVQMFDRISVPEDKGDFFSFARLMIHSDEDIDAQEEKIFDTLKAMHMGRLNEESLRAMVKSARKAFDDARLTEQREFEKEAKDLLGLTKIFSGLKRPDAA